MEVWRQLGTHAVMLLAACIPVMLLAACIPPRHTRNM
jgi:hypothetical protein